MAKQTYAAALRRVLADEGGNDDDPRDPGGRTSRGIIQSEWSRYRGSHRDRDGAALPADVWQAPQWCIEDIYRSKYWDTLGCDQLPAGVDYAVFDYGVNSGPGRAAKVLRRLLALSDTSGAVTPDVIAAACRTDAGRLAAAICDERLAFLQHLPTWETFGRGWSRRVTGVKAAATAWAAATTANPASPGKGARTTGNKAKAGAAGGIVVAGAAAAQALGWRPEDVVLIAVVIVIAIAALFGWLRRRRARRQQATLAIAPIDPSTGG